MRMRQLQEAISTEPDAPEFPTACDAFKRPRTVAAMAEAVWTHPAGNTLRTFGSMGNKVRAAACVQCEASVAQVEKEIKRKHIDSPSKS